MNDPELPPKPFPTWVFNEAYWTWVPPVPPPDPNPGASWDEETQSWIPLPEPLTLGGGQVPPPSEP